MSRPEKERTAALGSGVVAIYKTNGQIKLISEREVFEGDREVTVVPPQEIIIVPAGIKKLLELISGPDKEHPVEN